MIQSFTKNIEFSGEGVYIRFMPVANVPGYTHMVKILDQNRTLIVSDWLTKGTRITESVAVYYAQKHRLKIRSCGGKIS